MRFELFIFSADLIFKMVDGLKYKDEVLDELKKLTKIDKKKEIKSESATQTGKGVVPSSRTSIPKTLKEQVWKNLRL